MILYHSTQSFNGVSDNLQIDYFEYRHCDPPLSLRTVFPVRDSARANRHLTIERFDAVGCLEAPPKHLHESEAVKSQGLF